MTQIKNKRRGKKEKKEGGKKKKEKELWATPPSKAWSDTKLSAGEESNSGCKMAATRVLRFRTNFCVFFIVNMMPSIVSRNYYKV